MGRGKGEVFSGEDFFFLVLRKVFLREVGMFVARELCHRGSLFWFSCNIYYLFFTKYFHCCIVLTIPFSHSFVS